MPYPSNATSMTSVKFQFRHRYLGVASCEMLYECATSIEGENAQALSVQIHTQFGNVWKEIADHECALMGTIVRHLAWEGEPDIQYMGYTFEEITGDRGDVLEDGAAELDALPPYVALLIRKYTNRAGRQNQGRMFIPYLSEQIQHDGVLDSGNQADAKAVADFLHTPITLAGTAHVFNPRLWNLKDNLLVPITRMMACNRLVTRNDRAMKTYQQPLT